MTEKQNYLFLSVTFLLVLNMIKQVEQNKFTHRENVSIHATFRLNTLRVFSICIKGVLHLLPKISMFSALSENNQQIFEK